MDHSHSHSPIAAVTEHLGACSRGRAGRLAIGRLAASGVPIARDENPLALACRCRSDPDAADTAALIRALLAAAGDYEMAGLCLLVALGPVLGSMARRLGRSGLERADAEARVLGACWAVLIEPDPGASCSLAGLTSSTWSRVRSELRRELRHRTVGASRLCATETCETDPLETTWVLLGDARRAGVLSAAQAKLIYETRVLDRPVELLGEESGRTRAAIWKDRWRAERALRSYLLEGPR